MIQNATIVEKKETIFMDVKIAEIYYAGSVAVEEADIAGNVLSLKKSAEKEIQEWIYEQNRTI